MILSLRGLILPFHLRVNTSLYAILYTTALQIWVQFCPLTLWNIYSRRSRPSPSPTMIRILSLLSKLFQSGESIFATIFLYGLFLQLVVSPQLLKFNFTYSPQENEKKWYGIDIMWQIIQDETDVPPATAAEAFRFLETFLTWLYCHELRPKYIGYCIQNLKQGKSVPFSLKLLQKLIGSLSFFNQFQCRFLQSNVFGCSQTHILPRKKRVLKPKRK